MDDLIDRPLIAKADKLLISKTERHDRAVAGHETEQTALSAALAASEKAVAGEGGDPLECALKVEEASRRERVAADVRARAADERRKAQADRETAGALALKPVHQAHRLRRLAAARKGDAADAMKAEAVREYAVETAALRQLVAAGLPDVRGALDGPAVFLGEAAERKLWADRGIDEQRPDHQWDPGAAQ